MSYEYKMYLVEHRENVRKGFYWFSDHLPLWAVNVEDYELGIHDESKDSPEEYDAYDAYFYGGNKSYEVVQEFNVAWLIHIHRNPHHWQHWVLINDNPEEGEIILDMPLKYIVEMICDWWSFSWKTGDLYEIFGWYDERKDYIKLSDRTRTTVLEMLSEMRDKLDELEGDSYAK